MNETGTKSPTPKWRQKLERDGACTKARRWCRDFTTAAEAWEKCENLEWMIFALCNNNKADDRKLRLFACWCARNTPLIDGRITWDLLTDERSRAAIEISERFANGQATEQELDAAWAAARDAACAAARDAARAAAGDAARDAAWAAAWAAAGDAAGDAAGAAAWAAAEKSQADALRAIYKENPFKDFLLEN